MRSQGHRIGTVIFSKKTEDGDDKSRAEIQKAERNKDEVVIETKFPKSKTPDYTNYEIIAEDKVMVIGDVEIPDHDSEILKMAYDIAVKYDIKTLIINGDLMAVDSFSRWARDMAAEPDFIADEYMPTREILTLFLRQFDRIIWCSGNHERRLPHYVEGRFSIGFFALFFSSFRLPITSR